MTIIGYEVIWEELYDSVQCVYTLTDPAIDQVWIINITRVEVLLSIILFDLVTMY